MTRPGTGTRGWFIWMTTVDGHDHAVSDEEVVAGMGIYQTLCGARILPAPLVAPPEPRCAACLGSAHAPARVPVIATPAHRVSDPVADRRRQRRRGPVARWATSTLRRRVFHRTPHRGSRFG